MNYPDYFRQLTSATTFGVIFMVLSSNSVFAGATVAPTFSIPVDNAPFLTNSSIRFSSNENRRNSRKNRVRVKPFSSPTSVSESRKIKAALTSLMKEVNSESNIINSVLSYNSPKAKQSFSLSYGLADPETRTPMSDAHQFHIGSMSKVFTATVILQLMEEGYFDLDTQLGEIFGDRSFSEIFPNHVFTERNSDGVPIGKLNFSAINRFRGEFLGAEITILDLITHTHGMPDLLFDAPDEGESLEFYLIADSIGFPTDLPGISQTQWTGESLLEYYIASGLPDLSLFQPDGGFHYGGTGYVIAGLIIEMATGMSLDQVYRERIFDPLGMDDTYLYGFEAPRVSNSVGLSHRFFDLSNIGIDGIGNVDVTAADWNTTSEWASSGLVSTVSDLHNFYRSFFAGKLFSNPDTYQVMSDYIEPTGGNGIGNAYGPGLGVVVDFVSREVIAVEHSGYWGSYFIYEPESDSSIVVTVNQVSADSGYLIEGIRNIVLGSNSCPVGRDVSTLERKIDRYERKIALLSEKLVQKNKIIRQISRARERQRGGQQREAQ